ncbi:MAG TPA: pyrimidine dimer DNA glycosylase/endonuclease V [Sphingomicrobium sp.]|nr:pyrimidine dimer DNA glycosylase/endonuclease V [Sphingomicrobium sp.]
MRLWSLHPKYLDTKGLVAAWREGLLAQAVLAGQTRGYRNHPQLRRFAETPAPERYIASWLQALEAEAARRGYRFDVQRIGAEAAAIESLVVTDRQLEHEWAHLKAKLAIRAPRWLARFDAVDAPEAHPLFRVVAGEIANWEAGSKESVSVPEPRS